jgi:hypothetical protein
VFTPVPQTLSASVKVVHVEVPLFRSQVRLLPCEGSTKLYVGSVSVLSTPTVPE